MKAKTMITEKDSNRFWMYLSQLFLGTAFIPQMVFSELYMSAKTVVAPNIMTPTLMIVANEKDSVVSAFSIIA